MLENIINKGYVEGVNNKNKEKSIKIENEIKENNISVKSNNEIKKDNNKSIKSENKIKGNYGEKVAKEYINKLGYEVVYRNFKCSFGEIDIVFKDKEELVFAEIKTRTNTDYGFPAESVTYYKRKHILNTARYFLYKYDVMNMAVRFDIIEVYLCNKKPIINHIRNVFW